jgi:hypothetical protein
MNTPEKQLKDFETGKSGRGGKREGAGRPAGSLELRAKTLLEVKKRIAEKADDLLNAELVEALGANIILKRVVNGLNVSYEEVSDPKEITKVVNSHKGGCGEVEGEFYIVTTQKGNYKSRQYLFDRAFGRPSQSVEVTTDPELARLKSMIEACARENGTTYEQEKQIFLDQFADKMGVQPEVRAKLSSELVQ